jgi:hypothetical protein
MFGSAWVQAVGIMRASSWSRALAPAEVEALKQPEQPWGCTVMSESKEGSQSRQRVKYGRGLHGTRNQEQLLARIIRNLLD